MEDKKIWRHTTSIIQRCIYLKLNKEMDKRQHPLLPQERQPQNPQELQRNNSIAI